MSELVLDKKSSHLSVSCCNVHVGAIQEVEKLHVEFESEQKKNKDLASQIIKLNGIIKTGHDALTQEQNLVKKLQEELSTGGGHQVNSVSNFKYYTCVQPYSSATFHI